MVIHSFDIYFLLPDGLTFFLSPTKSHPALVSQRLGFLELSIHQSVLLLPPSSLQPVGSISRCKGQEEKEVKVLIPPTSPLLISFWP